MKVGRRRRWGGGKGAKGRKDRGRGGGGVGVVVGRIKEREGGESINEGVKEAGREECKASCVKYLTLCEPL